MGNTFGGTRRKTAKIMKINGETTKLKLKNPIQAMEITKNHPGHVLLDSDLVKQYGTQAKPLDPTHFLEAKKIYFLVELPDKPNPFQNRVPRRVRSGGIQMGAKERLESLMLSRRTVSDLSALKPSEDGTAVRVRMRLPKSEVERLMSQSKDRAEAAQKIMDLCVSGKPGSDIHGGLSSGLSVHDHGKIPQQVRKDASHVGPAGDVHKKKRVAFMPVMEDEIQLAVAS